VTDPPQTDEADDDGVSRRWLIRLLVGLGIGIPVLVEGTTVIRLIRSRLFGGEDGNDSAGSPTETPTPAENSAVGVGDELLAATPPADTVREAFIRIRESSWEFTMTVAVDNTTEVPYALRLGAVRTTEGDTVSGSASTGRIPSGESAIVTGRWSLPQNSRPDTVTVTALSYAAETGITERQVELERISIRG